MIPGGAVNNTPRSCVPGFRSLVCFIKMHYGDCSLHSFYPLRFAAFHSSYIRKIDSIESATFV
ncbi:hypothetical protein N7530_007630 [Penicillium desertorum]|uniref:Uncharacterized protein n=1 Tax=Penicillium desertorum TaxID=1303715 RepID=A0A9X0BKD7_9EURO|nr:hypothetical protein N7530_007630 [Penicillium desertorum]